MRCKLYQHIAANVRRLEFIKKRGDTEFRPGVLHRMESLEELLPEGSGFDSGCIINHEFVGIFKSIQILAPFHHMDEHGGYSHWVDYKITVRPTLIYPGFELDVKGDGVTSHSEYIGEMISCELVREYDLVVRDGYGEYVPVD